MKYELFTLFITLILLLPIVIYASNACLPGQTPCGQTCCPSSDSCCIGPNGEKGCAAEGSVCCPYSPQGYCPIASSRCCPGSSPVQPGICAPLNASCCPFSSTIYCEADTKCCTSDSQQASCIPQTSTCCPRFTPESGAVAWSCPATQGCCSSTSELYNSVQTSYCYDLATEMCCSLKSQIIVPAVCPSSSSCCLSGDPTRPLVATAFCCKQDSPCCGETSASSWISSCCAPGYACCPAFYNLSTPWTAYASGSPFGSLAHSLKTIENSDQSKLSPVIQKSPKSSAPRILPESSGCANVQTDFCCLSTSYPKPYSTPCPVGTLCCPGSPSSSLRAGCCTGKNATSYKCNQGLYCPP